MRTVTVELCGETLQLPVNYAAGSALSAAGFDPFAASVKRFEDFTGDAAIRILHIGASAAGYKLTLKQVGECVYERGVSVYVNEAAKYLLAFVTATTEHPVPGEEGAA